MPLYLPIKNERVFDLTASKFMRFTRPMSGTSVRESVEVDLTALSREDRIATLRARMDRVGATPDFTPEPALTLALPGPLGMALAGGGLAKQAVTQLSDTPALAVELLAHTTAHGGYAAVVGWPELLLAGVADAGGELSRLIAVPEPGLESLNTAAVLCEGMDLVLYRHEVPLEITPARARPLLAKLRNGRAALLLVNARVTVAVASIDAHVTNYHGIGRGAGRIRGLELDVRVTQKGRPPARIRVPIGEERADEVQTSHRSSHLRAV